MSRLGYALLFTVFLGAGQNRDDDQARLRALERLGARIETDNGAIVGVDLFGCLVTDGELANLHGLTQLESLNLSDTDITEVGLAQLKGLTSLKELNLSSIKATADGLAYLKGLTSLRELDLGGMHCTDAGLSHLTGLKELESLNLWDTNITDAGLAHLKELSALRTLDLSDTAVTDAGIVHLSELMQLQSLDLSDTAVTDTGLLQIARLPRLQELTLQDTLVTGEGLMQLAKSKSLALVDVTETRVKPWDARAFQQAAPEVTLWHHWGITLRSFDGKAALDTNGVLIVFEAIPLSRGVVGGCNLMVSGEGTGSGSGRSNDVEFRYEYQDGVARVTISDYHLEFREQGSRLMVGKKTFALDGPTRKTISIDEQGVGREATSP